jgi:hypothetical protein
MTSSQGSRKSCEAGGICARRRPALPALARCRRRPRRRQDQQHYESQPHGPSRFCNRNDLIHFESEDNTQLLRFSNQASHSTVIIVTDERICNRHPAGEVFTVQILSAPPARNRSISSTSWSRSRRSGGGPPRRAAQMSCPTGCLQSSIQARMARVLA